MKRMYLIVISIVLAVLLGLGACAPGWGQLQPGGMMSGQGGMMGSQGGMMGDQGGMMSSQGGMMSSQGGMMSDQGGMMSGQGGMMGGMPMMGGMSMMDSGGMMSGMPMMGGMMGYYSGVIAPLSHGNAKVIADQYLASVNNPELEIDEFEEYSHNFYVSIIEKSTGRGAAEVIIDRYNGSLQLEPQSMMWNSRYGMMGNTQQAEMAHTSEQALKTAQDFLDKVYPGTEADEITSYYGYYTIMTTLEGKHYGMLSVNDYSGDVWYHTWHGMFISEVEE